jgi:hypothetical protein
MHGNGLSNSEMLKPIYSAIAIVQTFNDGVRGQLLDKTPLLVCVQIEMKGINR